MSSCAFLANVITNNFMEICEQRIIQQALFYPYHANSYSINTLEYLFHIYCSYWYYHKSIFEQINMNKLYNMLFLCKKHIFSRKCFSQKKKKKKNCYAFLKKKYLYIYYIIFILCLNSLS